MNPSRPEPVSDAAVLALIACLAGAGAALWLWAGLAGAMFGHGWAGGGIGELLGAATRLPGHLSDPARAWPAPERTRLPGPEGFYGALLVLVGAGAALVLVARR